jgi:hypothetical protein
MRKILQVAASNGAANDDKDSKQCCKSRTKSMGFYYATLIA